MNTNGYKKTFVIGCLYTGQDWIFESIESIKNVYGDRAEIIVVDSGSEDQSYLSRIDDDVIVAPFVNENYTTGMIWRVYESYPRNEYYFIHDNVKILAKIDLTYFQEVKGFGTWMTLNYSHWRWDSRMQFEWVNRELKSKAGVEYDGTPTKSVFGEMLFVKRKVLTDIKATGFDKILPQTKYQSCGMERAWGIILNHLGYKFAAYFDYDTRDQNIHLRFNEDLGLPICKIKGTGARQ